jgi:hypothetical protein
MREDIYRRNETGRHASRIGNEAYPFAFEDGKIVLNKHIDAGPDNRHNFKLG